MPFRNPALAATYRARQLANGATPFDAAATGAYVRGLGDLNDHVDRGCPALEPAYTPKHDRFQRST